MKEKLTTAVYMTKRSMFGVAAGRLPGPPGPLCARTPWVSGMRMKLHTPTTAPRPASTRKMVRQVPKARISEPSSGARAGTMRPAAVITLRARAARSPWTMSWTIARPSTMPELAAMPWNRRRTSMISRVGAKEMEMLNSTKARMPTSSGRRLPNLSDSGPMTIWPSARPMM